jgi:hypothetical protein
VRAGARWPCVAILELLVGGHTTDGEIGTVGRDRPCLALRRQRFRSSSTRMADELSRHGAKASAPRTSASFSPTPGPRSKAITLQVPRHRGVRRADVLAESGEQVRLELLRCGMRLPSRLRLVHRAQVVLPGQAEHPALVVERPFNLVDFQAGAAQHVEDHGRVEVARPRAHHEPFERCQAHGRGPRCARRRRRTRSPRCRGAARSRSSHPAHGRSSAPRHGRRRRARFRESRSAGRRASRASDSERRRCERGPEGSDERRCRTPPPAGPPRRPAVPPRCPRRSRGCGAVPARTGRDRLENVVIHEHGRREPLAAMHHPVPDRRQRRLGKRRTGLPEGLEDGFERMLVVGAAACRSWSPPSAPR